MSALDGKQIAVLTSLVGVEKSELEQPLVAIRRSGGNAVHVAPELEPVRTVTSDTEPDSTFDPDLRLSDADAADFDALVVPGGTVNADHVRGDEKSVALVRAFAEAGKPIAVICHGPWALVEAGVLPGKTLTSYRTLRTDITNAGGTWVDCAVKHCTAGGWDLITSRNPDDLDAFTSTIAEVVGAR